MPKFIIKERWEDGTVTYLSSRLWSTKSIERAMAFTLDDISHYWEFIKPRQSRKPILIPVSEG